MDETKQVRPLCYWDKSDCNPNVERMPTCALMIAAECVITACWFFHIRHHFTWTTSLDCHSSNWLSYVRQRFVFSSSTALNLSHTCSDTCENTVCFLLPAAVEAIPIVRTLPAHCGGKKLSSNILHLPLFISLPWRTPLKACKLIYNAVSPPSWVEDGRRMSCGSILCVCWKVTDVSVALQWWGTYILYHRANMIGAILSLGFLDLGDNRFRSVIGFGITMATTQLSVLWVKEWHVCVCVCVCRGGCLLQLNCHPL